MQLCAYSLSLAHQDHDLMVLFIIDSGYLSQPSKQKNKIKHPVFQGIIKIFLNTQIIKQILVSLNSCLFPKFCVFFFLFFFPFNNYLVETDQSLSKM